MVNWITQRNATDEKVSQSSLQVWCDLHSKDQTTWLQRTGFCAYRYQQMLDDLSSLAYLMKCMVFCFFFFNWEETEMPTPMLPKKKPIQKNSQR